VEKRKAHYSLSGIKELISKGKFHITRTASQNGSIDFSLTHKDIIEQILGLENNDLCKSMTCNKDSSMWQDVYYKQVKNKVAYIKVQIAQNKSVVIQFKNK
jgi:hypothetical protein